jgi:hypothetical protein
VVYPQVQIGSTSRPPSYKVHLIRFTTSLFIRGISQPITVSGGLTPSVRGITFGSKRKGVSI